MILSPKKYLIIFDTNCIYAADKDNSCAFVPLSNFTNFLTWAESENISRFCTLAIPRIVLLEIAKQKFDRNEQSKLDYEKVSRFFDKQYDAIICKFDDLIIEISNFLVSKDILIIDHPSQLEPIILRAVHKRKPFDYLDKKGDKKEHGSDKGFKDAVLLHSVMEIENLTQFQKAFICTNNHTDFAKCDNGGCANLEIKTSKNSIRDIETVLKEYIPLQKTFNWIEENKDSILAYLNDYGGDWVFTDFTYEENNFHFLKDKNVVEFTLNLSAIGDFAAEGLTSDDMTTTKWFDLRANGIIEPEDISEGKETAEIDDE
ncbi:MAG: PIN domain-containing protein [Alphaproteobacteria bacterium]|nr:PIN domain-containing protein [Alphaproteobacteria bacterium]